MLVISIGLMGEIFNSKIYVIVLAYKKTEVGTWSNRLHSRKKMNYYDYHSSYIISQPERHYQQEININNIKRK